MNRFKGIVLTAIFAGASLIASAQNSAVTNTHFALKEAKDFLVQENYEKASEQLAKARSEIDKAVTNEKTMGNAKTWNYRGEVYAEILRIPGDKNSTGVQKMEAAELAVASYKKTIELDDSKRGDYKKEATNNLNSVVYVLVFNEGIQQINDGNSADALKAFEVALLINPMDSNAAGNAALAAERLEDKDKEFSFYKRMIDQMKVTDHYAHIKVADFYRTKEDYDNALKYVQKGIEVNQKAKKEKVKDLYDTEFNIYLASGRLDEAVINVKKGIEADPTNDGLHSRLGQLYDKMNEIEGNEEKGYGELAVENYKKALEINPANLDANFNLGAYYYNKAAGIYGTVNNMDLKTYKEKGAAMEKQGEDLFNQAIPYFKKALEMAPEDPGLKNSLKTIYTRLKNYEEAAKYK